MKPDIKLSGKMIAVPMDNKLASTPAPWKLIEQDGLACIMSPDDREIIYHDNGALLSDANAAHIVKCVNLMPDIISVLSRIESCEDGRDVTRGDVEALKDLLTRAKAAK